MKKTHLRLYKLWVLYLSLVGLFSCGKNPGKDGLLTDANVCKPLDPADVTINVSHMLKVPSTALGSVLLGQLTEAETSAKYVWGYELYLGSALDAPASINMNVMIKRSTLTGVGAMTVGPDGQTAIRPFLQSMETVAAKSEPGWVRGRFPGSIELKTGEQLWLLAEPGYTESQSVNWYLKSGTGLYVTTAGSPVYAGVPGTQVAHRLIYCE
jgi:hypothetical protein